MKIIAVMNQKGGVGKTTVTVNLAAGLALNKQRVLLIDADLQANATTALGLEPNQKGGAVYDLFAALTKQCTMKDSLLQRPVSHQNKKGVLDVVPATIALSGFDQLVRALPNKQVLMKQMLQNYKNYDYILIDCPPSLGLMTVNALVAADEVLIPVLPEFFGLQGLSQIVDTIKFLQNSLNPDLEIGGIVCTRYNRRNIHQEVVRCLHDRFDKKLFGTKIYENIAIAEAPSHAQTIFEYNPHSTGAHDFDILCRELLNRQIHHDNLQIEQQRKHRKQNQR
ncbi:MAG: hypothetical protein CL947_00490 [Epsilonproteobacteria bacterium]|nr:hypothetical protein [Campylobacterota bacterium]|tara:strand:- start:293 stop:1132 length:840 start_codon:yes stop_codon:yes gene_type:complete